MLPDVEAEDGVHANGHGGGVLQKEVLKVQATRQDKSECAGLR